MTVTAIVVAFGAAPHLARCVGALLESVPRPEVVLVDNGALREHVEAAAAVGPVRLVDSGGNVGFGGGCNRGATAATGDILLFVNPDAVVQPGAVASLAAALADPAVGIVSASVRLMDRPDLLNSAGGAIHFTGLGWSVGFEQPAGVFADSRDIASASGAAMAMRATDFRRLGGFAEELFLYHEDAELSVRAWFDGLRVRYVPGAVVLHDYDFARNPGKLYYLERNRHILVATCFERRTLVVLSPALLAVEGGMLAVALMQGWLAQKLRAYRWLVSHLGWIRRRRRAVQTARQLPDAVLVPHLSAGFDAGQIALPAPLRPAERLLAGYWRMAVRALGGSRR